MDNHLNKAKKSLGQNWLKSESAVKEIIKVANLQEGEEVLEIGPGRGVLTKALIATGAKVLAIEKDDDLIDELLEKFADDINNKKMFLVRGDILDIKVSTIFPSPSTPEILPPKYKLVANIPYYITGQIIRKFLSEEENQPTRMVLMLQKEVARRIVGRNPSTSLRVTEKESLLSIAVKVYGTPKYIKTIPAGAFEPKPKVDSAILLIENISRDFFASLDEKKFFAMLKKGFGQKRKLLKSNLGVGEEVLQKCNIPVKARAENLTVENWKCLAIQLGS